MTSTSSAWKPISLSITRLQHTVDRVPTEPMVRRYMTSKHLIPALKNIQSKVREFSTIHPIPADAQETIKRIGEHEFNTAESYTVQGFMIELGLLQALLDPLSDFEARATGLTDRAFEHLQRLIIVDEDVRKKWNDAFNRKSESGQSQGEISCEKLGAVHLLWHGIWAFKAHSTEERTDLVLGEPLVVDETVKSAATALVLTEWKVVKSDKEAQAKVRVARKQAETYAASSLAGFELGLVRYLVMVSLQRLRDMPSTQYDGDVTYRTVNIAVAPDRPSDEGKRALATG